MIIEYKQLEKIISQFDNKTKVLVGGCFDVIHYGHIVFLKKAKKLGEKLIVCLESDEFIIKKKKRKPIHNLHQRAIILNSIKFINLVIKLPLFKGYNDYLNLVKKIRPNFIAITKGDPKKQNKKKQAKEVSAKVIEVTNKIDPFSTSYILQNASFYRNKHSK